MNMHFHMIKTSSVWSIGTVEQSCSATLVFRVLVYLSKTYPFGVPSLVATPALDSKTLF